MNESRKRLSIWDCLDFYSSTHLEIVVQEVFGNLTHQFRLLHYLCRRIGGGPQKSLEPTPASRGQYGHYAYTASVFSFCSQVNSYSLWLITWSYMAGILTNRKGVTRGTIIEYKLGNFWESYHLCGIFYYLSYFVIIGETKFIGEQWFIIQQCYSILSFLRYGNGCLVMIVGEKVMLFIRYYKCTSTAKIWICMPMFLKHLFLFCRVFFKTAM